MTKGRLKTPPNLGRGSQVVAGGCGARTRRLACCLLATCASVTFCACSAAKGTLGGMFGMLKGLVGSKSLSREDMESVLDKMRDHLIGESGTGGLVFLG